MSEPLDLDAIDARATAATPGPWLPHAVIADIDFVAHARTDVPALLARVRALESLLREAAELLPTNSSCDDERSALAAEIARVVDVEAGT